MQNYTRKQVTFSLIFVLLSMVGFSQVVNIPDANFKAALVADSTINTNRDSEIQVSEAQAYTGRINVQRKNIADLTGVEAFTALTGLDCSDNQLRELHVDYNPKLTTLFCSNNALTSFSIHNNNNGSIPASGFNATNNPNLHCIEVDNIAYAQANWSNGADPGVNFTMLCDDPVVYIPDANFKAALLANRNINRDGDYEIQVEEAANYIGYIDVSGKNISDLTGIGAFNDTLFGLDCSNNNLTTLDARVGSGNGFRLNCRNNQLTSLIMNTTTYFIDCSNNRLTTLDLSKHNSYYMSTIYCQNNQLTKLILPSGSMISSLWCFNNQLTSLDLSGAQGLGDLQTQNNQLTTLNVSANAYLKTLLCNDNNLTSLNIKNGNNKNIPDSSFNATNNPNLHCIDVSDVAYARANWKHVDPGVTFSRDCSGTQVVSIPDANFKSALVKNSTINTNGDNEIQVTEAEVVTTLNVPNQNIASLAGIDQFVSLENLNCSKNQITALDVRASKALKQLRCSENLLASLNVTGLDNLNQLRCDNNKLTNLNLSTNTGLVYLHCNDNQITSLNVSANRSLQELDCSNNRLTYLNVRNGNNINFTLFKANGNPNIACTEVDDVSYAQANWSNKVDAGVSFSLNCFVNIPDPKFKAALLANTQINTNRDSQIHITEALAFTGTMDVADRFIADLTGIEAFKQLTRLLCRSNRLSTLNVSANDKLVYLNCSANQIKEIHLPASSTLVNLDVQINQITAIDVSALPELQILWCAQNRLTSINLSSNKELNELVCERNQLTQLDVSANSKLSFLLADDNSLASLDLKDNTNLTSLYCNRNRLTALDVSHNAALRFLLCAQNQLTALDLRANTKLSGLECQLNQLSSLKTSTHFSEVLCNDNQLDSLTIDADLLLCQNNKLVSLNGSIIRSELHCSNNKFTSLDLSASKTLWYLYCPNNQLTFLNLQNGNNRNMYGIDATNNPELTCVQVDDPAYSKGNPNWIVDPQTSYSLKCGESSSLAENSNSSTSNTSMAVSPNPTKGTLNISTTDEVIAVTAYNEASGATYTVPYANKEADLSGLRSGTYLISVQGRKSKEIFRVVKE
jgi:Leucine-rich repeat (LRR) protein